MNPFSRGVPFGRRSPLQGGPFSTPIHKQRAAVSNLFTGPVVHQLVYNVAVPVIRDEQVRYALILAQTTDGLRGLLHSQTLRGGDFAFILDGQHRIVANSLSDDGLNGEFAPPWMRAALGSSQPRTLVGMGLRFGENAYAFTPLPVAPGWTLAVGRPFSMINATAWHSVRWLPFGGLALAFGVGLLVWLLQSERVLAERRNAETQRAARAEVERVLARVPAMIFLREIQPDGSSRLLYRAGDLEAVTGWPTAAIAELEHYDHLLHPRDDSLMQMWCRLLRDGQLTHEWRLRQPDGGWRSLHTIASILRRLPDGGAEIVGYTVDMTAHRAAEARALSTARLASLGEMAAGMAHELKQPLQAISLAAEMAALASQRGDRAGVERRLDRILAQTERTARLIDHLRRFARGNEDGALPEAVSLGAAVDGALELCRGILTEAGIDIDVALGEPAPVVQGQLVLLEQVITNLLLNARDALAGRPAGVPRRIRLAAAQDRDSRVILTVSDTGGGIAPEIMQRLFEPFVTTKGPDKGTGLGLSICHGLIREIGGTIEGANGADGAVFTIRLRRAEDALAERSGTPQASKA